MRSLPSCLSILVEILGKFALKCKSLSTLSNLLANTFILTDEIDKVIKPLFI